MREAIQAFPEVYFSRLVVMGEGDSEEIVLPRLLQVKGAPIEESAITIAPLGGQARQSLLAPAVGFIDSISDTP